MTCDAHLRGLSERVKLPDRKLKRARGGKRKKNWLPETGKTNHIPPTRANRKFAAFLPMNCAARVMAAQ